MKLEKIVESILNSTAADRFEHIPKPFKDENEEYRHYSDYHQAAFEKFKQTHPGQAGGLAWQAVNDHREKVQAAHAAIKK